MDKEFTQNQYYINEKPNFFFFFLSSNKIMNTTWFL